MDDFNLTVMIDQAILQAHPADHLCLARKVSGRYTTVFMDASLLSKNLNKKPLNHRNEFKWSERFAIFGTTSPPMIGTRIISATNEAPIKFGQKTQCKNFQFQAALNAADSEFPGDFASKKNSFIAGSIPSELRVAVKVNTRHGFNMIYLDDEYHVGDVDKVLTPTDEYMIFWARDGEANGMIPGDVRYRFEFEFPPGKKSMNIRFGFPVPDNARSGGPCFHIMAEPTTMEEPKSVPQKEPKPVPQKDEEREKVESILKGNGFIQFNRPVVS